MYMNSINWVTDSYVKQFFLLVLVLSFLASCGVGSNNISKIQDATIYAEANAKSMTEGKQSFTGRILIPPPTGNIYVQIVTSSGKEIKAKWPGWSWAMFINSRWHGEDLESYQHREYLWEQAVSMIDPSQIYQIDILTAIHANSSLGDNEILRVLKNGHTIIEASICQVHKVPMKRQIESSSSADAYPESFFPQQKKEFPNDGNVYLGCGSGSRALTWKCPECGRRHDGWINKYGIRE